MHYILILLVNFIYLPAIWFGLISDDDMHMRRQPFKIKRTKIASILIHLLTAEYIYYAFGHNPASLMAAILFSVHPMTVQVSCWMSGRWYGLNALIFMMILSLAPIGSVLYFFANRGIGTLLFTPLIFLFTEYRYLAAIFPVLAWLSFKHIRGNISAKIKGDGIFSMPLPQDFAMQKWDWKNLIITVKTLGYYSLACLLPLKNGFYNSFLSELSSSEKANKYWYSLNRHFWGGILAMVLMAGVWWFNRSNYIGMGIYLFILSLIPFLNFITVQQFVAPRYAYLPLIGLQVALVSTLSRFPHLAIVILPGLFVFYLDHTVRVMRHYRKDNITMINLDSEVFPDNPRLWYFRYEHMLHRGNALMAWAEATYGLKHLPEDCQLWFGLSCASFELGDLNAAAEFLKTAEKFMMVAERENMRGLIAEMRERISKKLQDKYLKPRKY